MSAEQTYHPKGLRHMRIPGTEGEWGNPEKEFYHSRSNEFVSCRRVVYQDHKTGNPKIVFIFGSQEGEQISVSEDETQAKAFLQYPAGWSLIEIALEKLKKHRAKLAKDTTQETNLTEEMTSMEIDNVTLLQIEAGTRMVRASFNKNATLYTFKVPAGMELKKGDRVIANLTIASKKYRDMSDSEEASLNGAEAGNEEVAFAIVTIDSFDEDFEPKPGITYCWIVQKLDTEALSTLPRLDRTARKKLRLGAAISQARQQLGKVNLTVLPGITLGNGDQE